MMTSSTVSIDVCAVLILRGIFDRVVRGWIYSVEEPLQQNKFQLLTAHTFRCFNVTGGEDHLMVVLLWVVAGL